MLSPQISVHVSFDVTVPPVQVHPVSIDQDELHPSPLDVFPSSHPSPLSLLLLPQTTAWTQVSGFGEFNVHVYLNLLVLYTIILSIIFAQHLNSL